LEGVSLEEEDVDACSPMTPARQAADELDEPLVVSASLLLLISHTAGCNSALPYATHTRRLAAVQATAASECSREVCT
jgi:hypothetical protein